MDEMFEIIKAGAPDGPPEQALYRIQQTYPDGSGGRLNVDWTVDLAEPLTIDVLWDAEENEFILSNEKFHLLGVADTLQDAMQEIEHGVLSLHDEYLREDDENLTKGGRDLKSRLLALFCCGEE